MPTRVLREFPLVDFLKELVNSNAEIVMPLVFFGVFIIGLIACVKRGSTRRYFVIVAVVLLVVSSQLAITMVPFVHAQRYSNIDDQVGEGHNLVIVDSSGNELRSDDRATTPVRDRLLTDVLLEASDEERLTVASMILENSETHREDIQSFGPTFSHPPPSVSDYWDAETLEEYGDFESVRVYHVETRYEAGGHHVEDRTVTCAVEITPATETITEGCANV